MSLVNTKIFLLKKEGMTCIKYMDIPVDWINYYINRSTYPMNIYSEGPPENIKTEIDITISIPYYARETMSEIYELSSIALSSGGAYVLCLIRDQSMAYIIYASDISDNKLLWNSTIDFRFKGHDSRKESNTVLEMTLGEDTNSVDIRYDCKARYLDLE